MTVSPYGHYTKTTRSVTIYTEGGHCKGSFSIYLHNGDRYIRFFNNWIYIQEKHKFSIQATGM